MNGKLIQILPRVMRGILVAICFALLPACASQQIIEHGIKPEVKGTQAIYDIEVLYGKEVINFRGMVRPGGGGGWNAPMPVPEAMTVNWTVNGVRQQITIPLMDKLLADKPLENWRLVFYGEQLELWREVLIAPPATPTGLRPRQSTKVFP